MGEVRRVRQMRPVVEAEDYDEAVRSHRDVLGGAEELVVDGDGGERVTILDVGRATLELSDPAQVEVIDRVEVAAGSLPGCVSPSRSQTRGSRPGSWSTPARRCWRRRPVRPRTR